LEWPRPCCSPRPCTIVALWRAALRRVIRAWRDNTASPLIGQIRRTGNRARLGAQHHRDHHVIATAFASSASF
jgi:hypothetical protein